MSDGLLILTEAGDNIGYGHVSRCAAILNYCVHAGTPCNLLLDWHGDTPNPTGFENNQWLQAQVKHLPASRFVLVDSYKAPLEYFSNLKLVFEKVFVLDDYGRFPDFGVDLVINPNIFGDDISYSSASVGGKDFVILREAFRKETVKATINNNISRILVTVGGSDPRHLLPLFSSAFSQLPYRVHFACGNDDYARTLSSMYLGQHNYEFHGYTDEYGMKQLMLDSDVAISACGQTLHELAYLGVPVIGVCTGEDQVPNMNYYCKAGVLPEKIEWNDPGLAEKIYYWIGQYNYDTRVERYSRSTSLIDGSGVKHIVDLITA